MRTTSLSSAIRCPCRYYFKRTVRQEWHLTNQHLCGVLQQKSNPPLLRRASSIFGERNPAEVNLRLMRTNVLAEQQSLWNNLLRPAKFQTPRRLHTAGPCSPLNTSEKAAKTSNLILLWNLDQYELDLISHSTFSYCHLSSTFYKSKTTSGMQPLEQSWSLFLLVPSLSIHTWHPYQEQGKVSAPSKPLQCWAP